jgi:hypothetical protein
MVQTMKISENAIRWLANGERCASSETIFTHLTGIDALNDWHKDHPYDPAVLRRCRLLLEQCPELMIEFPRMAQVSAVWRKLVHHWAELCGLMDEEIPEWRKPPHGSSAPRLYARMKEIIGR